MNRNSWTHGKEASRGPRISSSEGSRLILGYSSESSRLNLGFARPMALVPVVAYLGGDDDGNPIGVSLRCCYEMW